MAHIARELGITRGAVASWRKIPALRVLEIERITNGAISRYQLRPDLYPERSDASRPKATTPAASCEVG